MQKKPDVSVIITHFNAEKEIIECLKSLEKIRTKKNDIEFILVDNDEVKKLGKKINNNFPWVKYVPADGNIGFGAGCNLGRLHASGKYLYFTNSDITISKESFYALYEFIKKSAKTSIVSPKLINVSGNLAPQATTELTPFIGLFTLSFINKFFPNNPITRRYLMTDWDRKSIRDVDVIQLGAFFIKTKAFDSVGGFEKKMFLYFEENELANKLRKNEWKLIFFPKAEAIHLEAKGTPKKTDRIINAYKKSRYIYFKKHYGLLSALLVEGFLSINKWTVIFGLILFIGAFLRFYRLPENLIFHGELGVDYLAVRDIIKGDRTALLGPRTSHEWLYLAPIFFWIMAILLPIFNYHPLVGAYFFAVIGVLTILLCYKVVSRFLGKQTGLISSYLMAISPAWVRLTRDSRFNAIAAMLFFPFIYLLVKSVKDTDRHQGKYIFWLGLILGLSYSFFPTIIVLLPSSFVLLYLKRKQINKFVPSGINKFVSGEIKLKSLWKGLLGLLIPLIPFLIYNFQNKFDMLFKLFAWVPYRIAGFLGFYPKNTASTDIIKANFNSLYTFFWESILAQKNLFVLLLFAAVLTFYVYKVYERVIKEKSTFWLALSVVFFVTFFGLFLHGDPPKHYYLAIFPIPLILLSDFIIRLSRKKIGFFISVAILIILTGVNLNYYFSDQGFYFARNKLVSQPVDYAVGEGLPVPYKLQEKIVDVIVTESGGRKFELKRVGPLDNFEGDFAQNYYYLLWRKGHEPVDDANLTYTIYEDTNKLLYGRVFWVSNIAILEESK